VVKVRTADALPPEGTVTVTGFCGLTVTPLGAAPDHPAARLTVEPNPSSDDRVIVADCEVAGVNEIVAGEGWTMLELIEKSGDTGASTDGVPATVTEMSDV
jgi:hypothetical protein